MISSRLNVDCHHAVASHLPDTDLRTMTQVSTAANQLCSQDRFYSPPANELRHAWAQVHRTPENDPAAAQHRHAYRRLQKFHQFVRQQPPPFSELTATRQQDPHTYAVLEGRFTFADAPAAIQAIVAKYAEEIPVLDLGDNVGATGYLNFLQLDDLSHPVMRGLDRWSRPFLSVKATQHFPDGRTETSVGTIFQRFRDNPFFWVRAHSGVSLFDNGADTTLHTAPEWCGFLGDLLASKEVHVPARPGNLWERREARRVTLG